MCVVTAHKAWDQDEMGREEFDELTSGRSLLGAGLCAGQQEVAAARTLVSAGDCGFDEVRLLAFFGQRLPYATALPQGLVTFQTTKDRLTCGRACECGHSCATLLQIGTSSYGAEMLSRTSCSGLGDSRRGPFFLFPQRNVGPERRTAQDRVCQATVEELAIYRRAKQLLR